MRNQDAESCTYLGSRIVPGTCTVSSWAGPTGSEAAMASRMVADAVAIAFKAFWAISSVVSGMMANDVSRLWKKLVDQ